MSLVASVRRIFVPIHPEGLPFIAVFAVAALLMGWLWLPLFWVGFVLTLWCTYFFRDPVRVTPQRSGLVVSPADGRVSMIIRCQPPVELGLSEEPMQRISIFMNVFDCHVNRALSKARSKQSPIVPACFSMPNSTKPVMTTSATGW